MYEDGYEIRFGRDKFQILTNKLSDAIVGYFYGQHPETTLDNIHACHSILKDIGKHFSNNEEPTKKKKPSKTIQPPEYYSDKVENKTSTGYFRRKRIDGQAGLYITLGNAVKHADKDTESLTTILDQHVYEYLYTVIRDYLILRDTLEDSNIVKLEEQYLEAPEQPSLAKKGLRSLANTFLKAASMRPMRAPQASEPFIDYAIDFFLGWAKIINEDAKKSNIHDPDPFWDTVKTLDLGFIEARELRLSMYEHTAKIGKENLIAEIKEAAGLLEEGRAEKIRAANRKFIKEGMRKGSRQKAMDILIRKSREKTWPGTGYYLDIEGKRPSSYTSINVDPRGLDHF